jgi:hypothetical protein
MPNDTGAISLLMLAAALLLGILGISERVQSQPTTLEVGQIEWLNAESEGVDQLAHQKRGLLRAPLETG